MVFKQEKAEILMKNFSLTGKFRNDYSERIIFSPKNSNPERKIKRGKDQKSKKKIKKSKKLKDQKSIFEKPFFLVSTSFVTT